MADIAEIVRCPSTHGPLTLDRTMEKFGSQNGTAYSFGDNIGRFLAPVAANDGNRSTRAFYEEGGWATDSDGLYEDTKKFVDTRPTSLRFTRACMERLQKYFSKGGQYLLDAGSGPIAHKELLGYGDNFDKRVCLDLSVPALHEAQRKLGDRGIYLQGDLTNLPIQSNVIDAVMSYHVIYQLPPDLQAAAFRELWRVLKPGGIAVIVYWWAEPKLPWKVERVANILLGKHEQTTNQTPQTASANVPDHNPHSFEWFRAQDWPFPYKLDTYRVVGNSFLQSSIPDDWRGAAFLKMLMTFQRLAPAYCGKHGLMPAIVLKKARTPEISRYVPDAMRKR